MIRATKAPFPNRMVPAWALNETSRLSSRTSSHKLAPNAGRLLRINEAAIHLNVSEKTVRRLIRAKALSVIRIGRLLRIKSKSGIINNFLGNVPYCLRPIDLFG